MRRREVIAILGGAAVAWPFASRAQRSSRPTVGVLASRSPEDSANVLPRFRDGLSEAGFAEGEGVTIEYRWARGHYDRLPALTAELLDRNVAAIAAFGPPAALAAKNATATIPVVFVSGVDPVAIGLVSSINQPGGNVTGVNILLLEIGSKRMEMLAESLPSAKLIAFLANPKNQDAGIEIGDALAAARRLNRQGFIVNASNEQEIEAAFAAIVQRRAGALFVGIDPLFNSLREKVVSLAARNHIPAIYYLREFAELGGLISYGPSLADAYRQAGTYVGRILKGAKPADLPVLQPTKFELVVNLKTARALGIEMPPAVLARADEVIE